MTLVYDDRSQKANNSTTTTTALQDPNIPSFDDVQAVKMYRVFAWLVEMMTIQQFTTPTGICVLGGCETTWYHGTSFMKRR